MPRTIYIVRHAERLDLVDATWIPAAARPWDPPVSEHGLRQARHTGSRLARYPVARVFTSPFLRCMQTAAEIVAGMAGDESLASQVLVNVEHGLAEFMCKAWFEAKPEMLSLEDMVAQVPTMNLEYQSQMSFFYPETIEMMSRRYQRCIRNIVALLGPDEHCVIVTHGYGVQFIVEDLDPSAVVMETPYSCISVVTEKPNAPGKFTARLVADASHLEKVNSSRHAPSTHEVASKPVLA
ncbi:hypothetical protein CAOG_05049 [Capsaspora owczarzaki ATCC 30864]|uniref:Phosphoglycerate mutase n=1 Tax=Capsaspora owczarzaki (strain ATCC 30864) TaxID=595528 RepID=A0A0D2UH17_CAPO3|nr:hypothetical protein CAOG_05049 [Capsaspora owczarzaki ATCC 30864]KJE94406.1 hypothetical protein CAOG_005049 [Capsaspora owczarzaki ATCC 30864]|eukprot:XP_004346734.2 hypothetical protein CAOG_05049 [Capsaspora owczarzaki ATCC 30864]